MEFFNDIFALIFATGATVSGPETDSFSPISIFFRADMIVRGVIIVLVVMSLISWAIIFERWLTLRRLSRSARVIQKRVWRSENLKEAMEALRRRRGFHPHLFLFRAAMNASEEEGGIPPARLARLLTTLEQRLLGPMGRGLDMLATIGSTAPFIGLFGTVWGIMNSFQGIAISGDTSLAVIAPGIAEALFATGLGLFAAIPAVIFYNRLGFMLRRYGQTLSDFSDEVWFAITAGGTQNPGQTE